MLLAYLQGFSNKYYKYGNSPNTIDIAKFVAIVTMVIDHIGFYFYPDDLWFRVVGRASFLIWGFLAGYSRPGKFSYEIYIIFAILELVRTVVFIPVFPVNVLFTIILCRFYADFLRKDNNFAKWKLLNLIFIFIALLVWFPVTNYMFEYGTLAFMLTICGILQREMPGHLHTKITFVLTAIAYIFIQYMLFNLSTPQFIGLAIIVLTTMHFLSMFNMKSFPYLEKSSSITRAGMFIARNSLYFYFLHLVLFVILSKIIFPMRYTLFKWL